MIRLLTGGLLILVAACSSSDSAVTTWPMVTNCDLHHQACTATHESARVTLDIRPRPIQVARPLEVSVSVAGMTPQSVALDISGVNMYMGYNRVELQPAGVGHWTGHAMLAFCTNREMVWRVSVLMTLKDGRRISVPFRLVTRRVDRGPP